MPVVVSPDSEEAKELAKWESRPTRNCPEPQKPYVFQPYPAAFYYATRPSLGGTPVFQMETVENDTQAGNMRSRGWGNGQAEAVQRLEEREQALAVGEAERHFSDRRMSEKAQAEADAFDESTDEHVPVIPEAKARKKPGRKPKVQTQ